VVFVQVGGILVFGTEKDLTGLFWPHGTGTSEVLHVGQCDSQSYQGTFVNVYRCFSSPLLGKGVLVVTLLLGCCNP
jgi:hypothetical protein